MNTFGRKYRVSIFGESHGEMIGVVLDGVPEGIQLTEADFEEDILRRKSGAKGTTPRLEDDKPQILSGVYNGATTGAPVAIVFRNGNTHSSDYDKFVAVPRPGHADMTAAIKWDDFQDPRGGGHFSGRLTLPIVAAGVVAKKVLKMATRMAVTPIDEIKAEIVELGGIPAGDAPTLPDVNNEWQAAIDEAIREGDSLGAVVECIVPGVDPGYGEPFWDGVESVISHAIFAIPGVRGLEFGDGFKAAAMKGSEHNDPIGPDMRPVKNGAGGVNGGITSGAPLVFRVAFKPTSSIRKAQKTFNFATGQFDELVVPGRHDVCFALRAPVVVEAMTAITLADLVLV